MCYNELAIAGEDVDKSPASRELPAVDAGYEADGRRSEKSNQIHIFYYLKGGVYYEDPEHDV